MGALTKKHGPFPLWAWIALIGIGGYAAYRYANSRSEQAAYPEEGFYPSTGIAPAEAGESSGAGGIAGLSEFLDAIQAAGYVPRGSEEGRAPVETVVQELPEPFQTFLEGRVKELSAANKAIRQKARERGKQAGKGGAGGRGAGAGRKGKGTSGAANQPKAPHTNHQPGHTAPTNHGAATHPSTRTRGGARAVGKPKAAAKPAAKKKAKR